MVLVVWSAAVVARLAHLQVVQHDALVAYIAEQVADTEVLPGLRGRILDRNGATLAVTVQGDVIVADPQVLDEPGQKLTARTQVAARVCAAIAGCAAQDRDADAELLRTRSKQRVPSCSGATPRPADAQRVSALELRGVFIERESRRFYPNRELAAHVVGHVDDKPAGLAGVEFSQDANIRGRDGKRLVFRDGRRRRLRQLIEQPRDDGRERRADDRPPRCSSSPSASSRAGITEYGAKGGGRDHPRPLDGRDPRGRELRRRSTRTRSPRRRWPTSATAPCRTSTSPGRPSRSSPRRRALDTKTVTPETPVNVDGRHDPHRVARRAATRTPTAGRCRSAT